MIRKNAALRLTALALAVLLAGCEARIAPAEFPSGGGKMTVVAPSSSEALSTAPEKPPISAENPLGASSRQESSASGASSQEAPPESSSEPEAPPSVPASASAVVPKEPASSSAPASSQVPSSSSAPASSQAPSSSVPTSSQAPASSAPVSSEPSVPAVKPAAPAVRDEVRAVWISYLELGPILTGKTEKQFTASIRKMFDNCADYGLNTIIAQVRPFADALYDSDYFPWSYLCTGTEGVDPGFDPLAIMVREARARGLSIEAWLNPYRVRHDTKYALSQDNQAKIWLDQSSAHAASSGTGYIVFNPASEKAQELIVNGVQEIVRNYDVDGIHIDDYFYPTTQTGFDASFDLSSYAAYKNAGGKLTQGDWRRQNVDTLVKKLYSAIKQENPRVLFGISPQSSVPNNYNALYFDVEKALSNPGYCDYICPQIYFGFENGTQPYAQTLALWDSMVKASGVKLYAGLAVYKCGLPDSWAGDGKAEWQQNSNLISRQVVQARGGANYGGFVLYRYDSLFSPASGVKDHIARESANLAKLIP